MFKTILILTALYVLRHVCSSCPSKLKNVFQYFQCHDDDYYHYYVLSSFQVDLIAAWMAGKHIDKNYGVLGPLDTPSFSYNHKDSSWDMFGNHSAAVFSDSLVYSVKLRSKH